MRPITPGISSRSIAKSAPRNTVLMIATFCATFFLAACGKATVQTGTARAGFTLTDLQSGMSAVIVDAVLIRKDLTTSYEEALAERFGHDDSLSSYLTARLIDSLNGGTPRVAAVSAPGLNPRHIIHVRDLVIARVARAVPTALLPTGGQQNMQSAGGGTSESWAVAFEVEVWRPTGVFVHTGEETDEGTRVPDSTTGVREYSFSVTGRADVPLYAYKTALVEAINAAATEAARHLRAR